MELTRNQQKIRDAMKALSTDGPPFATADDVAEHAGVSKETVLNHADTVVREEASLGSTVVGQANVYYTILGDPREEIRSDQTEYIVRLGETSGAASYAEVWNPPETSEFDYEVMWYDLTGNLLDSYLPSREEIGEVARTQAGEVAKVRYHHA